jgi:hypothetical protein
MYKHPSRRKLLSVILTAILLLSLLGTSLLINISYRTASAADSLFYDFIAQASNASWSSGAGSLPFPNSDSDSRGFALYRDNWQLEDNSTPSRVLETHPQWVSNGWIMGKYPQLTVPDNAELQVMVGFIKGATGSDGAIFQVKFEEGQNTQTILSIGASYDGKLDTMTQSLSSLAGRTGRFILYVNAGQNSGQDWAAWAEAKIEIAAPSVLPDLVVTEIRQDGNTIRYKIENNGAGSVVNPLGGTTPFCNTLFIDGQLVATDCVNIHEMLPGQFIDNPFDYYFEMTSPQHTIRVCADWDGDVDEENEQNNCLEVTWYLEEELPDLIIEEIMCDQDNSRLGYVVKNSGEATASAGQTAVLFIDDEAVAEDIVAVELAPGESYESWFSGYAWPESYNLEADVCADNYNSIAESDEQNNCLSGECLYTVTPPPTQCPGECQCLTKEEGYANGLEFCLDDNGSPIVCGVIDAEEEIYTYCFQAKEEEPTPAKPVYPNRDVDGDDQVSEDDVALIATHYGGETGTSHLPWDINDDGVVDFKDLAIVGAHFGRSITEEKLEDEGIITPQQLLDEVGSASGFQELMLRADIDLERLLQATLQAELEDTIPTIDKTNISLLEGQNIGSLAGLQSLSADDAELMNMVYHEIRLEWIASGAKERGEPLPTIDDLTDWVAGAQGIEPILDISEGIINFPDGSSLPLEEEDEDEGGPETLPDSLDFGLSTSREFTTDVFNDDYPGMGGGVLEEESLYDTPPPSTPELCPQISGYIVGFPYDVETLKIQAERIEMRTQFDYMTREMLGIRPTVVEGMMLDVQQSNSGPHGSLVTFYNTGCITPGTWKLTPIYYAEEPETVIWRGDWSPYYQEVEVISEFDVPTDVDFTFIPIETIPPTITITHSPTEPGATDTVTFTVTVEDDHMLQKIEVYEWGRYPDGSQTEPELVASYFWDSPSFPLSKTYRFERGPYPVGEPNEIHFEVAAWDYAGNPRSETDVLRVAQFETPPITLLGFIEPTSVLSYYIGSIAEVISSKDSDDGLGELHPSFNIELIGDDGGLYQEFRQDYPYYKHVEADASDGSPYCSPWVPVLAVEQSELEDCSGYSLHAHVYESDSAWERVIRAVFGFFEWLIDTIWDALCCITGDVGSCEDLICNIFSPANSIVEALMDSEDDYIGSAHFITTAEANFGLGDGSADDSSTSGGGPAGGSVDGYYTLVGTPNAEDSDWIGTTVEGIIEDYCHAALDVVLMQGESTVEDLGSNWIEVLYHPEVFTTQQMGEVKVKFVGATVISDRDGLLRGEGDIYARTLVGAIGGSSTGLNDHSLDGDDLNQLPYSAADTYRFDCGEVSSGHSFTKDKLIFDHSFSDPNIAMLYVQIGLWDDDGCGMPDNEIGVLSIPWPADSIFDMIEHPDEAAARYGAGITVTIVHAVRIYGGGTEYVEGMPDDPNDEYYYVITDTREVWTRLCRRDDSSLCGYPGAQITYQLWVRPGSLPTIGYGESPGGGGTDTGGTGESPGGGGSDTSGGGPTG